MQHLNRIRFAHAFIRLPQRPIIETSTTSNNFFFILGAGEKFFFGLEKDFIICYNLSKQFCF